MPIYKGAAKRLDDIDLPKVGAEIGVGEDVVHALIEVETRGTGFDSKGRVIILFEPHKFYANLRGKGDKLSAAVEQGLAYPKWGMKKYPKDSYPRLEKAIEIDETAALRSCSWGMGQVMGDNFRMLGYDSVQDMVSAFAEDEEAQLKGMIDFIKSAGIDDDLRRIERKAKSGQKVTAADWVPVVRVYNGPGYLKNNYHTRAATAFNKWLKIKDTPFGKGVKLLERAAQEEIENEVDDVTADENIEGGDFPQATVEEINPAGKQGLEEQEVAKGVTTSSKPASETEGTPPPAPAAEVKASSPSIKSAAAAVLALIMGPLSFFGIDTREAAAKAGEFAQNNTALAVKIAVLFGFAILAYYIWNKAMERAHQRTLKVMDAAADKDKNNLRLI